MTAFEIVVFWICFLFCTIGLPFLVSYRYSKSASYDCSKCKNWGCEYHFCKRKREKLESKSKEQ